MKLISCYIKGYGALKDKTVVFNEGITQFLQSNGIGKTTLASFLKAMLYGLKTHGVRDKDFKDREHFSPFDRDGFGGTVTLEHQSKTYRIERSFDEKSEKKDTLTIYKDGVVTNEFDGKDLGVALLGVNRDSFERTLFITSEDMDISTTPDVKTKLGGAVHGGGDDANYQTADNLLSAAVKAYNSRSRDSLIPETKKDIEDTRSHIANLEKKQEALKSKYAKEEMLEDQVKGIQGALERMRNEEMQKAQRKAYDELIKEIGNANDDKTSLENKYPNGIPSEEDIITVKELQKQITEINAKSSVEAFSEEEQQGFDSLKQRFQNGLPTEAEIEEADNNTRDLNAKRDEIRRLDEYSPSEKEEQLLRKFSNSAPTEESLSEARKSLDEYERLREKYDSSATPSAVLSSSAAKISPVPYVAAAVVSVIIAIVGIALLASLQTVIGAVLTAVGAVILLLSGFLYLNKKTSAPQAAAFTAESPERARLINDMKKKEDSVKAFLLPYGYNSEKGIVWDMNVISEDLKEFESLSSESERRNEKKNTLNGAIADLEEKLSVFFRGYGYAESDYVKCSTDLKLDKMKYEDFRKRENEQKSQSNERASELDRIIQEIEEFKKEFSLTELSTDQLLLDRSKYESLTAEIAEKSEKAENYRVKHQIQDCEPTTEHLDEDTPSIEQLNEALNQKSDTLVALRKEIYADEADTEKLDEYRSELATLNDRLKKYEKKHKLLSAAQDMLSEANDSINKKYVEPVLREFRTNAKPLTDALGTAMTVNHDFELLFERDGRYRSEKYLSTGQRALCLLCFRIALVKNLYGDSLPFMILDDPFTALDETNMEAAKDILRKLSEGTQILYFTCHSSRAIDF